MENLTNKYLYIISGPNGAGKTTASMTILPEVLQINEFVNADIIAYGLSPFNPESVAIQAGRMMLLRIEELLSDGVSFAFETTLSTKSYRHLVGRAQELGYQVVLFYFWLSTPEHAINRVAKRVSEGGHNIPTEVIERRYIAGVRNLFDIYIELCDVVQVYDNTEGKPRFIFRVENGDCEIIDEERYALMKTL
ncbi:zeta toxin family protein [Fluviicola sp.]|uniref:zeta toxin family protein n=1 Tax=Fluviicola sp. TaxID=1917219 RepID=UPI0031D5288B